MGLGGSSFKISRKAEKSNILLECDSGADKGGVPNENGPSQELNELERLKVSFKPLPPPNTALDKGERVAGSIH